MRYDRVSRQFLGLILTQAIFISLAGVPDVQADELSEGVDIQRESPEGNLDRDDIYYMETRHEEIEREMDEEDFREQMDERDDLDEDRIERDDVGDEMDLQHESIHENGDGEDQEHD